MSSILSLVAEPVKVVLLMVWKPVTTTFSIWALSSFSVNWKEVRCPMTWLGGLHTQELHQEDGFGRHLGRKRELSGASVWMPCAVPFTMTEAPATGCFCSSKTCPVSLSVFAFERDGPRKTEHDCPLKARCRIGSAETVRTANK